MWNNPEFKRNLWLEFSVHRLIAAPLLLTLLFVIVAMQTAEPNNAWDAVATAASIVFLLATHVWGTYLAIDSISDEIRNRTWDNQRLSALSPFKLGWGKLFGATAFAWYIGLPCLVLLVVARQHVSATYPDTLVSVCALLAGTLLMQGLGLMSAIVGLKTNTVAPRAVQLVLIFFTLVAISAYSDISQSTVLINWYGIKMPANQHTVLGFALFTAWIWLACYRNMQAVLQIKTRPWAMVAFVIFCTTYVNGFVSDGIQQKQPLVVWLILPSFISIIGVYLGAFTEKRDWVSIRRFFKVWHNSTVSLALKDTPYFVALAVFGLFALLPLGVMTVYKSMAEADNSGVFLPIAFVLMLRDIGLLYYFSLGRKPARATMATVFYLVLLYVLIPALFQDSLVASLFNPLIFFKANEPNFYIAMTTALLHFSVVAGLLYKRYANIRQQM
jgi:hypothetical protein